MEKQKRFLIPAALFAAVSLAGLQGCAFTAGAAAGGAGAYEYSNKEKLEELQKEYDEGRINQQEYEQRKEEIEERSLVY